MDWLRNRLDRLILPCCRKTRDVGYRAVGRWTVSAWQALTISEWQNFQSLTNEYANYYNYLVKKYQVGSGSLELFFECDFDYIDFLINTKNVRRYWKVKVFTTKAEIHYWLEYKILHYLSQNFISTHPQESANIYCLIIWPKTAFNRVLLRGTYSEI